MAAIDLNIVDFRLKFPKFSDELEYPDTLIQVQWDIATCYISNEYTSCGS